MPRGRVARAATGAGGALAAFGMWILIGGTSPAVPTVPTVPAAPAAVAALVTDTVLPTDTTTVVTSTTPTTPTTPPTTPPTTTKASTKPVSSPPRTSSSARPRTSSSVPAPRASSTAFAIDPTDFFPADTGAVTTAFGIDATSDVVVRTTSGHHVRTVTVHATRCAGDLGFRVSCPAPSVATAGAGGSAAADSTDPKAAPIALSVLGAGAIALGGFAWHNRRAGRHL